MARKTESSTSLNEFTRRPAEVVTRLKETGHPLVLTVRGKPEVVVQDAAAYQRLAELADKVEMFEFLRESKADADAGRTVPARAFLESLGTKKAKRA
jgi:prevent-host-death family protein